MKKKPTKTVKKVKVTKIHPAVTKPKPLWLARDIDGTSCLYAIEPEWDKSGELWILPFKQSHRVSLYKIVHISLECFFRQLFGSLPGPGECWRIEI